MKTIYKYTDDKDALTTASKCDTCFAKFTSHWPDKITFFGKNDPIEYDNSVKMKISDFDSNGQRTGWYDKRYVKFTSDSTFVVLPASNINK